MFSSHERNFHDSDYQVSNFFAIENFKEKTVCVRMLVSINEFFSVFGSIEKKNPLFICSFPQIERKNNLSYTVEKEK